jgi:hypothetical protein
MLGRNGGQVALVIHAARFILSWVRVIQETRTHTSSNQLSWSQPILQVSRLRECFPCTVMMMLPTDMVTLHSRMFEYQQATWFLALVEDSKLFRVAWVLDVFITLCVPLVL